MTMVTRDEDFDAFLGGQDSGTYDTEAKASGGAGWFKRKKKGILTETKDKADAPEGLWSKCPNCKYTCTISELKENLSVLKCTIKLSPEECLI